jgi:hypothetical protein
VSRDKPIGDGAQHRIGFPRRGQLVAKILALPTLADAGHSDAEGFQHAPDVTFEVFAQPDHPFSRTDQTSQPVSIFAVYVDRCKPAGPRELRQSFSISGIGLVEPGRQSLVRLPGIDAYRWKTKPNHPTLQPDRKHPTLMYDPAWRERSVAKPTCHAVGVRRARPARDRLAFMIDNADRNFFQ